MSKALSTLIRLHKAQIDDVQANLALVVSQRAALAMDREMLEARTLSEQAFSCASPEIAPFYGAYAPRVVLERRAFDREDQALALQEDRLRDALSEAFIELKKIEQLISGREERDRLAENARELASLDEAAVARAGRRDR